MPQLDLLIRAERVVVGGRQIAASVGVRDGRIATVGGLDEDPSAAVELALPVDEVLMPGLVDTHVHVNDPGRSDWEGFGTATRAAAAGGVTTIIDMPLNSIPPTIDVAALRAKQAAAGPHAHVDIGFWGGAVPSSLGSLRSLWDAGVFGFKCFLLDSGVPEFPPLSSVQLAQGLLEIGAFDGLMLVHAEDADVIAHAPPARGRGYEDFLRSRPRGAENLAIARLIEAARDTGARAHLLHLSSSDALAMIASARRDGVRLTAETCPHYLGFAAEDIPDGATQFKCCPPIREAANQDALWEGLRDGVIDCVVTDHSPCTADLKQLDIGDFGAAWGGVASLQVGLPAVWTRARERGVELAQVSTWMSERPARLAGVPGKGAIEVGNDADFCVFAPDESFVVDVAALHHRNPISAYAGAKLTGVVRSTWLAGRQINDRGRILGEPSGALLNRSGR